MPPIRPFFDRYMEAYLTGDPKGFSAFFDTPCLIVDSKGDHVIRDAGDIEDYERPFLAALHGSGLEDIDYEPLSSRPVDGSGCFCTNRYRILGREKQMIEDMEYHYFLVQADDTWRIKFARMGRVHAWITSS